MCHTVLLGPCVEPRCTTKCLIASFIQGRSWWYRKKFVRKAIQDFFRLQEKKAVAVATSAFAAVLLDEERTAHLTFKIPISSTAESTCGISARSQLAKDLPDTDFIICDEIVMCHRNCVEAVDRSRRGITRRNMPFGGKCVLFSEDCRQILPVFPEARELKLCMLA